MSYMVCGEGAKEKLYQPEYSVGAESGKERGRPPGEQINGDAGRAEDQAWVTWNTLKNANN